jgi:hypothetical protein
MASQRKLNHLFLNAMIDTCTFSALFGRLRSPGDPKRLSGSFNVEQYTAMGDIAMAEARAKELKVEYRYATAGLIAGLLVGSTVVIGYTFLVLAGHSYLAGGLLTAYIAVLIGVLRCV